MIPNLIGSNNHITQIWSRNFREQQVLETNFEQLLLTKHITKCHENLTQAR
jgi:hypothetical protein